MSMKDVDLIALAGLLHDIGKFGQRSDKVKIDDFDWQDFCPRDKYGNPTHKHAAYTARILSDLIIEKQKSEKRIIDASALNNRFIDISAKHHIPETKDEWIVASADRLASGFEREAFSEYNELVEEEIKTSYKEQKLDHLFVKNKKFPLSSLSVENIFAVDKDSQDSGYGDLWQEFEQELKSFNENRKNFPEHIKAQSLEYLIKKYTTFMPSATSFKYKDNEVIKPNISLYEHLKTTSIFTSAIASMSDDNQNKVFAYYKDRKNTLDEEVFVLIAGDFFGIQEFIFNEVQAKFAAKTLRAKSAYIQILTKVLAYFVCDELGISYYSIISTHAGKFEILAPNFKNIQERIENIQGKFNEYFLNHFFGQTGVGITYSKASLGDFIFEKRYKDLRKNLADRVEEIKFKKFDLLDKGCYIYEVDEGLNNQNLCDFCHKRKGEGDEYKICQDCKKFVKIGEKLTKNRFLAISKKEKEYGDIEIFDGFYLHFFDNVSKELAKDDIAIFDISNDEEFRGFEKWELASYVAQDSQYILTFEELAKLSVKEGKEEQKRKKGVEAIISLKGDADGMGNFIKDSDVTNSFAKYNFFARMVDYYFSVYVPIKLMKDKPLYTVFAGGDDLFVLGAWDEMIDFSINVRDDFVKFTDKRLTFSTGHIMTKANKPINYIANEAEEMLENAKDFCCELKENNKCCSTEKSCCIEIIEDKDLKVDKEDLETVIYVKDKEEYCKDEKNNKFLSKKDAISLFEETTKWDIYEEVRDKVLPYLITLDNKKEINTTFLYRVLDLIEMSKKVKYEKDVKSTIWKSKLNYIYLRNISKSDFELLDLLNRYIEYCPKELKMVLFEFIYKRRENG